MSSKIHATSDALVNPTGFYLTQGQAHDLPKAVIRLIDIDAETLLSDSQRRRWASQTGVDSPAYRAGDSWQVKSKGRYRLRQRPLHG